MQLTGERTRKWIPMLITHLIVFSVAACMMNDKVYRCVSVRCTYTHAHSQPVLALAGIGTAACGIVVSHGVLYLCGVPLIQIAMITPFLVLCMCASSARHSLCAAVGVDDMFVLLNVWRHTDVTRPVCERMHDTFGEAAVSITIMRMTGSHSTHTHTAYSDLDAAVYAIGMVTDFAAIRIFCVHACSAVFIVYMYQCLCFTGLLAVSGYREQANRHCLTLRKVAEHSE
jgi:hypothetical protein